MSLNHPQQRRASQAGFTLVELLAVVIIIGVLSAVAIPAYNHYTRQARTTEATTLIPQIRLRVETYRLEMQAVPSAAANPGSTEYAKMVQGQQGSWDKSQQDWKIIGFHPPTPGVYFQYFVNSNNAVDPSTLQAGLANKGDAASCHGLIQGSSHYPNGDRDWFTVCARGSFTGNTSTSNPNLVFGMSGSSTLQRVFVDIKR